MKTSTILWLRIFFAPLWFAVLASGGGKRPKDFVVCLKEKGETSNSTEEGSTGVIGGSQADQLAWEAGFKNQGEVIAGSGCYHFFLSAGVEPRRRKSRKERLKDLSSDPRVRSVMKQGSNRRQKRGFMPLYDPDAESGGLGVSRVKRGFFSSSASLKPRPSSGPISDPYWKYMWYLNREGNLNMNVQGAWDQGISGRGVAVTILDDGIEKDHPDLIDNYDPLASTDINDNDSDPNPRYDFSDSNRHGTRCAGQVGRLGETVGVRYVAFFSYLPKKGITTYSLFFLNDDCHRTRLVFSTFTKYFYFKANNFSCQKTTRGNCNK